MIQVAINPRANIFAVRLTGPVARVGSNVDRDVAAANRAVVRGAVE